jgi:IclR family transcriptional regulator, KDG regulon repressor
MKLATTVLKVCRLMEQFTERQSLGVSELAARTKLLPSDVYRILTSLRASGFVEQDSKTKKYRMGRAVLRLGLVTVQRCQLCDKAQSVLTRLGQQIGAATHLGILDGHGMEIVWVDHVCGENGLTFNTHLAGPDRLHCTAVGKIILASLEPGAVDATLMKYGMVRHTDRTIRDVRVLQQELEQVRRRGYAVDHEEWANWVCCIGSPVHDQSGAIIGAVSASMPASRFGAWDESRLGARLATAAVDLSGVPLPWRSRPHGNPQSAIADSDRSGPTSRRGGCLKN